LQSYDPAQDTTPEYFERLLERASGKDLKWFFDYWVYHDRGLPDLSIAAVYPSRVTRGQVLVAVEIVNDGYATAEVPVTVKGATASLTERVRVPAHGRITHRITFQEEPTAVDVNDGTVPEVRDSVHERLITAP
jgi:aminopeptidase N